MTDEEALRCLFTVAHEACSGPIFTPLGTLIEDEDNFEYVERMYEQVRQALSGPPWARFLDARRDVIVEFVGEGKSFEEIADTLSMDADQVWHIYEATRGPLNPQVGERK